MKNPITPRAQNFPQWYQDILSLAPDLYDESPVTGCISFGPLATALWENMRRFLDARLRQMGVENILLPTLIPEHFFQREKEHVEGFAPEAAVVTHAGGEKLAEPFYVRPTSELLFVDWYSRSGRVQSHRDLPVLVNQWCSVMRWEKRPRAFLRTTEFHWQEGHCLFADETECRTFTLDILDLYALLAEELLAIPVVKGEKPGHEKFAGADTTYTIESMMQDGKALQMGTSHMLSQQFLMGTVGKPMVSFLDEREKLQVPFYDSWGVSTRLIGALFMVHGDDEGIVIPPNVAPVQAAVLPVLAANEKANAEVLAAARSLAVSIAMQAEEPKQKTKNGRLTAGASGLRTGEAYPLHGRSHWFSQVDGERTVRIDERPEVRLGEKTFRQIRAGTPVRIEIGERDLAEQSCIVKSRIRPREQAVKTSLGQAPSVVATMLAEDQQTLFQRAQALRRQRSIEAKSMPEIAAALREGKWVAVAWDGTRETADRLKSETSGGTYRCFAFDSPATTRGAPDPLSGKPSPFDRPVIVAKAY